MRCVWVEVFSLSHWHCCSLEFQGIGCYPPSCYNNYPVVIFVSPGTASLYPTPRGTSHSTCLPRSPSPVPVTMISITPPPWRSLSRRGRYGSDYRVTTTPPTHATSITGYSRCLSVGGMSVFPLVMVRSILAFDLVLTVGTMLYVIASI